MSWTATGTAAKPATPAWMKVIRPQHVLAVLFLIAYPLVASPFWTVQIGAQSLFLGVIALSLMFLAGYGGMVSLSQMTVAGVAGYMVAVFGTNSTHPLFGWPLWVAVPIAIVIAVAFAILIGIISVRTAGIYTIMITLAIGVAVFYFAQQNYAIFNGHSGFAGLPGPAIGLNWRDPMPFYYMSLAVAAASYLAVIYLARSTFGLTLQAIRDNARRMNALGFWVNLHRVIAHAVAGLIAAVGGLLYVWMNGRVSPGTIDIGPVIDILVIAVIGGLRHPVGPFIGAILFVLMKNFAIDLISPERFNTFIGLIFLVIVLVSPDGLLGLWRMASDRLKAAGPNGALAGSGAIPGVTTTANKPWEDKMSLSRRNVLAASVALTVGFSVSVLNVAGAMAEDTIKVGALATLQGAFTVLGEDGMRGVKLALQQHNMMAGGKKIELVTGSSDASPDSAVNAARKLVEQDKVQILVGPLSGDEGLAVKNYAKTQPQVTFINGTSAAQDTTLRDPAPNFFRFTTDGAQWQAGLGEYAFSKGYKKVVTIAEDYSFPYTQVFGFMQGFCKSGGHVVNKFWVPIGNKDFSSIVASIPDDIDAIYVALGGADAVNFLNQYEQAGGDKPMVGGSITVDQTVLGSKGKQQDYIIGTPSAGPIADNWDNAAWTKFVADYKAAFPDGFPSPSLFAQGYYVSTLAMLTALDQVKGDLGGDQKAYRDALQNLKLDTPTGPVTLDKNRNGIAYNFLTEVSKGDDGHLYNKVVKVVENVNQTLGMPEAEFMAIGPVGRDNPSCP